MQTDSEELKYDGIWSNLVDQQDLEMYLKSSPSRDDSQPSTEADIRSDPNAGKIAKLEFELNQLRDEVSNLNRLTNTFKHCSRLVNRNISLHRSFTTSGNDGMGGIRTCVELIISKKVALLQCVWLVSCVVFSIWFGSYLFFNARDQENSKWKPERKDYTIDYSEENVDRQYEMPYVYLVFEVSVPENQNRDTWLSPQNIQTTIYQLLVSQNYFMNQTSIVWLSNLKIIDDLYDMPSSFHEVDAFAVWDNAWVLEDSFVACFVLKLRDPDIGRPWIFFEHIVNTETLTFNGTIPVSGFWLYIGRTISWTDLEEAAKVILEGSVFLSAKEAFYENAYLSFTVGYTEKVTQTIGGTNLHQLEAYLAWSETILHPTDNLTKGIVHISIETDMKVEYWQEYVEYSYTDWLAAMGGLLSIASFVFFRFGFVIASFAKDHTMGILPKLSMSYRSLEMVHLLTDVGIEIRDELADLAD